MKKLSILLMAVCLFFSQLTVAEAKEKASPDEGSNNYHAIDYEVSESKTKNAQFRSRNVLPEVYDARTQNYVTSVKDQNPFGDCWAFSAMSTAETSALKNNLASDKASLDLSELQLAYFFYHRVNDPLGNTGGDRNTALSAVGTDDYLQNGGNNWMTAVSLSQWAGPVAESRAPYVNNSVDYPKSLDADLNYLHTEYAMKDAVFLPDNDIEGIKQAIINYGSVSIAYASGGINTKYFYSGSTAFDHSVTIVGYDNNVSKELFGSQKPENDGAWIVKNSWGSWAGDEGYFYLSYDQPLNAVVAYNYMSAEQYDNNYFYDGSASMMKGSMEGDLTAANVFQAKSGSDKNPEYLGAVSVGIANADTNYSVQIYTDLKDPSDPYSGTKALSQPVTGFKAYEGIYTIELPDKIRLSQGSKFAVVVTLKNKDTGSGKILIAQDWNYNWISMKEETAPQQSFVLENGSWYDTSKDKFCCRIKAFTDSDALKIQKAEIEVSSKSYIYNGEELKPLLKVTMEGQTLNEGTDYSIRYVNNVNAGKATLIITGENDYCGIRNISFTIQPRSLTEADIGSITSVNYNGRAQTPAVTVKDGAVTLKEGRDYTLAYDGNKNVGKASVTIKGIGNYTGEITRNFTIVPCNVNKLSCGSISPKTYIGKAQYPDIRITNNGTVLRKGTDYLLSYRNNTNAGTAEVTITGKGNYTGRMAKYFKIARRGVNTLSISRISNRIYSGKPIKPSVTVKYGSKTLKKNTDYTLSYSSNKNTGKATVKVTGAGNYTGSVVRAFYIVPKKTSITYAKSKKSGKVTIKYKKAAGAGGYQIAYRKKGTKSYKYIRTSKRSYTISKLSRKKSYQIKVRPYKTVGKTKYYGSYSAQKTVRIR
ncbi:C1 family peptidase [Anaerostipes sp.]|uniref:C1 family peptidase n=1 Tax=Anaerostipes sp. TaxID=1872530 RepID=UPI0025BDE515|nr:C1 family peptidase [Anaerostipes sp.]MBS7008090.1 cysteine protease [Anaerostipes sp.]